MDRKKQGHKTGKSSNLMEEMSFEDDMDDYMDDSNLEEGMAHELEAELTEVELDDEANENAQVERFFKQEDEDSEEPIDLEYLEQKSLVPDFAEYFFAEMENIPDLEDVAREMGELVGVEDDTEFGEEVDEEASEGEVEAVTPLPPPPPPPPPSTAPVLEAKTSETFDSGEEAGSEEGQEEIEEEESEVSFEELFALDRRASAQVIPKKVDYLDTEGFAALQTIIDHEPVDRHLQQAALAELEAQKIAKEKRDLENSIDQFLNDLLHQIVLISEQWVAENFVRSKVDKRRLLHEIPLKQLEIEYERKHHTYLEWRVAEHFKKKKNTRALTSKALPDFPQEEARYDQILKVLDKMLSCEVETKRSAREERARLQIELGDMRIEVLEKVRILEETVRRIVTRDDRHELKQAVNRTIALFAHERDKLRQLRTIIIRWQDVAATLLNKVAKVSTLGNGIMVSDFDRIQTNTLEMGRKVEEREQDLYRMRLRYTSSLHMHAHLKERSAMVTTSLVEEMISYERIHEYKTQLKNQLYNLKLKRIKIRKKINDLSFQCGLLDKESLMHEFDYTNDAVIEKRKRNANLRKHLSDLHAKLETRKAELHKKSIKKKLI